MIQRIAATTVIKGAGACQVYMDGVVSEEIKRLNEMHARELETWREKVKACQAHENKLLAERLKAVDKMVNPFGIRRIYRAVVDRIQVVWAMLWVANWRLGRWICEVRKE